MNRQQQQQPEDRVIECAEVSIQWLESNRANCQPVWDGYGGLIRICDDPELREHGVIRAATRSQPPAHPISNPQPPAQPDTVQQKSQPIYEAATQSIHKGAPSAVSLIEQTSGEDQPLSHGPPQGTDQPILPEAALTSREQERESLLRLYLQYRHTMASFQAPQGLPPISWDSQGVTKRPGDGFSPGQDALPGPGVVPRTILGFRPGESSEVGHMSGKGDHGPELNNLQVNAKVPNYHPSLSHDKSVHHNGHTPDSSNLKSELDQLEELYNAPSNAAARKAAGLPPYVRPDDVSWINDLPTPPSGPIKRR